MVFANLSVGSSVQPQRFVRVPRCSSQKLQRSTRVAAASFAPPTVADTKRKFLEAYDKPIGAIYSGIVQELLVSQHFMRYNLKYAYDEIFALGIVSVFNQVLDGMPAAERDSVFNAYIVSLDEDPSKYRADAEKLAALASACTSPADLTPNADGSEVQKVLAKPAAQVVDGSHFYTRFFAIGLFRMLELTDAKDPKALEGLVKAIGVKSENVNKDLLLYKSILSKMMAAKELMAEMVIREKRKTAEREAAKAAKAAEAAAAEVANA